MRPTRTKQDFDYKSDAMFQTADTYIETHSKRNHWWNLNDDFLKYLHREFYLIRCKISVGYYLSFSY